MIPVYQDDEKSATLIDSEAGFVIMAGDEDDPGDELTSPNALNHGSKQLQHSTSVGSQLVPITLAKRKTQTCSSSVHQAKQAFHRGNSMRS